jgi:hypothetical protein
VSKLLLSEITFKNGHELLEDYPCSTQSATLRNKGRVGQVHDVVLSDCHQMEDMNAEEVGILVGSCHTSVSIVSTITHTNTLCQEC